MAMLISRPRLVGLLREALAVEQETADAVVAFLTFKPKTRPEKGHRGLWSAPLVPVPGSSDIALALDNSKDARGIVYEAEYRKRIPRCDRVQ
jgi:hypothetical protein